MVIRGRPQGGEGDGGRAGVRFTDGSRMEGLAAAASVFPWAVRNSNGCRDAGYSRSLDGGIRVLVSDSQAVITRCRNLTTGAHWARSWIDE